MIDRTLPLLDLHRHLEGSMRLETVLDLGRQHGISLPAEDLEGLRPHVQVDGPVDDLLTFLAKFEWLTAVLADLDACRRIAFENVEDAADEGIDYVELRFSPWFMAEPHGLDPTAVVEAVVDGVRTASKEFEIPVGLIGTLSRTYGAATCQKELAALLSRRDHLVAIDLAGDEVRFPPTLFIDHFRSARDAGLAVTIHAGEAAGSAGVWEAVRELGAHRIGHGVRAIDDPALLDHLGEAGIGIEANLTSNVQTRAVDNYGEHPMAAWLDRGLLATLNTDDPTISDIDLNFEYEVAAPRARLNLQQIHQAQENAVDIAFLSRPEKEALRRKAAERGARTSQRQTRSTG